MSKKMLILPYLGLAVLLIFVFAMLFVGFATYDIHCERKNTAQAPDCRIVEQRLFGLYNRGETAYAVTHVGYKTEDVNVSSSVTLASTVYVYGSNGAIPISGAVSNVGDSWKSEIINKMTIFLNDNSQLTLSINKKERSVFGWVGLVVALILLWSTVSWATKKVS